jgi:hypothetical protein
MTGSLGCIRVSPLAWRASTLLRVPCSIAGEDSVVVFLLHHLTQTRLIRRNGWKIRFCAGNFETAAKAARIETTMHTLLLKLLCLPEQPNSRNGDCQVSFFISKEICQPFGETLVAEWVKTFGCAALLCVPVAGLVLFTVV